MKFGTWNVGACRG